jgi:hypothetical protein
MAKPSIDFAFASLFKLKKWESIGWLPFLFKNTLGNCMVNHHPSQSPHSSDKRAEHFTSHWGVIVISFTAER